MPELPDIVVYIEALQKRICNHVLERAQIASPSLLRTAMPPISAAEGKRVVQVRRIGKRICLGLEEDLWLVLHLMIAGRLHWKSGKTPAKAKGIATLFFDNGSLLWTEAGTQKRASLHLIAGEAALLALDPGGLEVLSANEEEFVSRLKSANHTLKRALTDPRLFSGIGNAYSDEILFEAKLSPIALTQKLTQEQAQRLFSSTLEVLTKWTDNLRRETGERFPEKVTAFRPGMSVHGRYKEPCPRCGAKIQRIRYASNETNYCPNCQTGGRLLADRSLSRLLRDDWPRTPEEMELRTQTGTARER